MMQSDYLIIVARASGLALIGTLLVERDPHLAAAV